MAEAAARKRGRPRNAATHQSILSAANAILAEQGYRGFSIEAVAAAAGVAKTSIYRRWSSKGALLLDLYMAEIDGESLAEEASRPVRESFREFLRLSVRRLERPFWSSTIKSLVAEAQADPEMARLVRDKVVTPRRDAARDLLLRGIQRGEIANDTNVEIVLDAVFGAIWYRLLLGHLPVDYAFADELIDQLFRWISPAPDR